MKISATAMDELPLTLPADAPETIWFAPRCCAVIRGETRDILAGGVLLASLGPHEFAGRNVLIATLAEQRGVHLGQLAAAFDLTTQTVRRLRRAYEAGGVEAIVQRKQMGRPVELSARATRRLEEMFGRDLSVTQAHEAIGTATMSRAAVGRVRKAWAEKRAAEAGEAAPAAEAETSSLPLLAALPPEGGDRRIATRPPESAPKVQHVGSWLLLAAVHALGLHRAALSIAGERVPRDALRVTLDAFIVALALGERCVEGVRRLATNSAAALLLASRPPSASAVRRTLGAFSDRLGAPLLQATMAASYLARMKAEDAEEGPVFYVDNHMRPYTGKHVVRRGWRMQDKRVRPGVSDYYVHDEDGRTIRHVVAPHHGSLTDFLSPICQHLRLGLGADANILVAFDRGGAFPEQLAALRDQGFEFVTYERRPYALLSEAAFDEVLELHDEHFRLHESKANLGGGRGRVRRISVRTEAGHQVNILTSSNRPAARVVEVMFGRWEQENAFKHANERWGINQLDGRRVMPYRPDEVIPNPARRRLENALQLSRVSEGLARNKLARLADGDGRRASLEKELRELDAEQRKLLALRPTVPTHAELKDTELAGRLVFHAPAYKLSLDTVRAACANAESDLATMLAPLLPRTTEAKKVLSNLFSAPGRIQVSPKAISVIIEPAATRPERAAIASFFKALNRLRLSLPGDQKSRPLRFSVATRL